MKRFVVATVCIFVFALAPIAVLAHGEGVVLFDTLAQGAEGEEVELLQTWLAEDPALYPEGVVSGVYGPATEAAVKRFQERTGAISGASEYGFVGAFTRAALNAEHSAESKNEGRPTSFIDGVAVVEGGYEDVALWSAGAGAFLPPRVQEYAVSGTVLKTLSAWVYPARLPAEKGVLFVESGDGYDIGMEGGRLFARASGASDVITALPYMEVSKWQHVSVIFTGTNAIFLVDNAPVEAGKIVVKKLSLFERLVSFFAPNTDTAKAPPSRSDGGGAPSSSDVSASRSERGIFGAISDFFAVLTGREPRFATTQPPTQAPPHPSADVGRPQIEEGEPTPKIAASAKPEEQKEKTVSDASVPSSLSATTTASVATTTPSVAVSTTTATTTGSVALGDSATTTATSTASDTTHIPPISFGGGGGGGGSAAPAPEPESAPAPAPPPNQPPTLALVGESSVSIPVGSSYTEGGATASDPEDGDLSSSVAISGDTVNTYLAGTYTLSYAVADSEGLTASATRTITVNPPAPLPDSAQEPSYTLAPLGEPASLSISSSKTADPKFVHADIVPLHVYVGQTQTLSVAVQSASPITSVTATTKLDNQTLTLNLAESGADPNGNPIYSTSWTVFDTHVTTYHTTFTATNSAGQSNSLTIAWSDPCSGVGRGVDSTLGANCTVSAVDGLDGGNLTIPGGTTLTLNSGAKWVWNSGKSITVTGAIAINGTATMEKGYLFYSGTSNDTAVSSTPVFDTNSTKTSHVRVQTWFKFGSQVDVAVSSVVTSPTVTIGGISGSQAVTLSGTGASKQMSINGGAWVTTGNITNGQTLRVRLTSSPNENTTTTVAATIGTGGGGGSVSTFSVRTIFNDPCPTC